MLGDGLLTPNLLLLINQRLRKGELTPGPSRHCQLQSSYFVIAETEVHRGNSSKGSQLVAEPRTKYKFQIPSPVFSSLNHAILLSICNPPDLTLDDN